ncbi:T9SS type A sorting domain-containing protein [Hymenobacter antarcticus]|uniref:Por secretion system C-terminal sorting domain-containing protein n=1 Tax=Hymenobacter antarcticus TaxID=486270 RepID=A0ABP7PVA0_9BACT
MKHISSLWRGWPVAGLLLILFFLTGPAARAQVPAWQTLVAAGLTGTTPTGYSYVEATTTDAAGNLYLVGNFDGDITLGGIALNGGGRRQIGIFVAKWSRSSNSFAWVQSTTGSTSDSYLNRPTAVAVQGTSVYVAGFFRSSSFAFGSTTLSNSNAGNTSDVFVAKLTDTGASASFVWALKAGGAGTDEAAALAVSSSNVYLAGSFTSAQANFGSISLANSGAPTANGFVAKLTDAGPSAGMVWAQSLGGTGFDVVSALAMNGSEVIVAGSFASATVAFGAISLANALPGSGDVFIAKLLDSGLAPSFTWAQRAGGTGNDYCSALAVSSPNIYLAGGFSGSTATFGTSTLANAGSSNFTVDVFVAKLADAGTSSSFVWAVPAGGVGDEWPTAVAVTGPHVYVAGSFGHPTARFGTTVLTNTGPNPGDDIFVAKLTDTGSGASYAWALQAGGPGGEGATGVVVSGNRVYVAGGVSPMALFGSLTATLPANNAMAFLASLTDPTLLATTPALSDAAFTLAPNPARTATTVMLPSLPGTASATLTLLDALGRAVRTATVPLPPVGLSHELDLSGLAPGLYAVQMQAGPATATRRLVVE